MQRMEPTASWTLDELTRRVADALSVHYDGQASGRVRQVPDQRVIRWYTTLGLVDRPAAMRGRTALYGPRHLRQLVAIKRLQARGLSLAEVQAELAGASETDLARIAQVPAAAVSLREGSDPGPAEPARPGVAARRFWASPPAPLPRAAGASPRRAPSWPRRPLRPPARLAAHFQGIRLGDEATLLIGAQRPVDDDDVRALRAAARPLLEALHARGLAGPGHEPGAGGPDHEPGPGGPDHEREVP